MRIGNREGEACKSTSPFTTLLNSCEFHLGGRIQPILDYLLDVLIVYCYIPGSTVLRCPLDRRDFERRPRSIYTEYADPMVSLEIKSE